MKGLIEEGKEFLDEGMENEVLDAGLIGAATARRALRNSGLWDCAHDGRNSGSQKGRQVA